LIRIGDDLEKLSRVLVLVWVELQCHLAVPFLQLNRCAVFLLLQCGVMVLLENLLAVQHHSLEILADQHIGSLCFRFKKTCNASMEVVPREQLPRLCARLFHTVRNTDSYREECIFPKRRIQA
jgi:hypothetical protein